MRKINNTEISAISGAGECFQVTQTITIEGFSPSCLEEFAKNSTLIGVMPSMLLSNIKDICSSEPIISTTYEIVKIDLIEE